MGEISWFTAIFPSGSVTQMDRKSSSPSPSSTSTSVCPPADRVREGALERDDAPLDLIDRPLWDWDCDEASDSIWEDSPPSCSSSMVLNR